MSSPTVSNSIPSDNAADSNGRLTSARELAQESSSGDDFSSSNVQKAVCFRATGEAVRASRDVCEMHKLINEIRPSHSELVSSASWKVVQERCRDFPLEIALLDARGRSCIHAACVKKAPISVIQTMLEGCGKGSFVLRRDEHGRTPLALAICSGASVDVVRLLLHYDQGAASTPDVLMNNPLHLACGHYYEDSLEIIKILLDTFPAAVENQGEYGITPLQVALESHFPLEIIQELVKAAPNTFNDYSCGLIPLFMALQYSASPEVIQFLVFMSPESTSVRDHHAGQYPMFRAIQNRASMAIQECLCTQQIIVLDTDAAGNTALHLELASKSARPATIALMLRTAPEVAIQRNRAGETPLCLALRLWQQFCLSPRRVASRVEQAWNCLVLLMTATHYKRHGDESDGFLALHSAVGCEMPSDVVLYCLERYPLQAEARDVAGRLPLHAALNPTGWRHMQHVSCIDTYFDLKQTTVRQLLHLNPKSAESEDNGRSMISLAATGTSLPIPIFRALWSCSSQLLSLRDKETGLFPFQLAALPKKTLPRLKYDGITRDWWRREDLLQLEVVYVLLKQAPELLSGTGLFSTTVVLTKEAVDSTI